MRVGLSSQSKLAKAIHHTLGRWAGPTRFLSDGRLDRDTNTAERTMRPFGCCNYLFAGERRCGFLASLLNTARLNDVFVWLSDVLEELISGQVKASDLHRLLVWNKAERAEQLAAA